MRIGTERRRIGTERRRTGTEKRRTGTERRRGVERKRGVDSEGEGVGSEGREEWRVWGGSEGLQQHMHSVKSISHNMGAQHLTQHAHVPSPQCPGQSVQLPTHALPHLHIHVLAEGGCQWQQFPLQPSRGKWVRSS